MTSRKADLNAGCQIDRHGESADEREAHPELKVGAEVAKEVVLKPKLTAQRDVDVAPVGLTARREVEQRPAVGQDRS